LLCEVDDVVVVMSEPSERECKSWSIVVSNRRLSRSVAEGMIGVGSILTETFSLCKQEGSAGIMREVEKQERVRERS